MTEDKKEKAREMTEKLTPTECLTKWGQMVDDLEGGEAITTATALEDEIQWLKTEVGARPDHELRPFMRFIPLVIHNVAMDMKAWTTAPATEEALNATLDELVQREPTHIDDPISPSEADAWRRYVKGLVDRIQASVERAAP